MTTPSDPVGDSRCADGTNYTANQVALVQVGLMAMVGGAALALFALIIFAELSERRHRLTREAAGPSNAAETESRSGT